MRRNRNVLHQIGSGIRLGSPIRFSLGYRKSIFVVCDIFATVLGREKSSWVTQSSPLISSNGWSNHMIKNHGSIMRRRRWSSPESSIMRIASEVAGIDSNLDYSFGLLTCRHVFVGFFFCRENSLPTLWQRFDDRGKKTWAEMEEEPSWPNWCSRRYP